MVSRLRLCRATQSARASASATVVIASTSTASCSPNIKVEVIGSKPSASPKGFCRSPTMAFPGAVKTFTLSVFDSSSAVRPAPSFSPFVLSTSKSFFISDSSFVSSVRKTMSGHQQDLPAAALLCQRLSLGRFTEWQFQTDRDRQLAIPHRFGHVFERFPVEFREYKRHLYGGIFRSVLRRAHNR